MSQDSTRLDAFTPKIQVTSNFDLLSDQGKISFCVHYWTRSSIFSANATYTPRKFVLTSGNLSREDCENAAHDLQEFVSKWFPTTSDLQVTTDILPGQPPAMSQDSTCIAEELTERYIAFKDLSERLLALSKEAEEARCICITAICLPQEYKPSVIPGDGPVRITGHGDTSAVRGLILQVKDCFREHTK